MVKVNSIPIFVSARFLAALIPRKVISCNGPISISNLKSKIISSDLNSAIFSTFTKLPLGSFDESD